MQAAYATVRLTAQTGPRTHTYAHRMRSNKSHVECTRAQKIVLLKMIKNKTFQNLRFSYLPYVVDINLRPRSRNV